MKTPEQWQDEINRVCKDSYVTLEQVRAIQSDARGELEKALCKSEALSKALANELMETQGGVTFCSQTQRNQFRAALSRCAAVLRRYIHDIDVSASERDAALAEAYRVLEHDEVIEKAAKKLAERLHEANFNIQTCNVCGCTLNCDAEYASGMCMAHANEGFLKL